MLRNSWGFIRRPSGTGCARPRSTDGERPGVTTEQLEELKELRKENFELRRANEILKSASAFFAKELDQPRTR